MKLTTKFIATSAVALAMLPAAAFADNGEHIGLNGNLGLHLGQLFHERHDDKQDKKNDERNERKHATTTPATTTPKQFSINGSVTFISGSTITVQGEHGATYSVNTANAAVTGQNNAALSLSSIKVGDKVTVTGSLSGSVINATKVHDRTDITGKIFRSLEAGVVTAINGTAVTISNFGKPGSTTVVTNSGTQIRSNGSTTTSSALTVGSNVLIFGTSSATTTNSTINASIIVILNNGLNWIKHLWK